MSGAKSDSSAYQTIPNSTESAPIYSDEPWIKSKAGKLMMSVLLLVISVMVVLAFAFCIAKIVQFHEPRYIALLLNIILSTAVTVSLMFCLYRGVLAASLMWYVFVQCTFLFFQLVTTDVFAWYEEQPVVKPTAPPTHHPTVVPTPSCVINKTTHKCVNKSASWQYLQW